MTSTLEAAYRWLAKAEHDLFVAQRTVADPEGPTDVVCFLSQQAVEKALKSALTAHGVKFERTHDLLALAEQVSACVPGLNVDEAEMAALSPYAVAVRYPGPGDDPSHQAAEEAAGLAQRIVRAVRQHLADQAAAENQDPNQEDTTP